MTASLEDKLKEIKVGDLVKWLGQSYIVKEVKENSVLLKQNFSIGSTLTSMVKIDEVKKLNNEGNV
tara:strand:- start:673 stop:870 length:198 start_codon:yes stop_codon:yes gene_type:complete